MLSDPALPFKRSMKMIVMRKEVEEMYEDQVEALYQRWEMMKGTNPVTHDPTRGVNS